MANKKKPLVALVTGGAGFLGSHFCERLLSEGYRVVCMDNLRTGSLENVSHLLQDEPNFEYIDHDVTTHINLPGKLDEIYHFASPASPADFLRAEIAQMVIELSGSSSELSYKPLPEDDPKRRCPDIARAREVLGWEPRVPVREGLKKTLEWLAGQLGNRNQKVLSF